LKQGDIYVVSLDPASSHEQKGFRPVLVISSTAFNIASRLPVIVPITSGGNFARAMGMSISLTGAGTRTTGVVRRDQPRVLDLISRGARKVESVPREILEEILTKVFTLFT
jgi:mRNA interferase ChpB